MTLNKTLEIRFCWIENGEKICVPMADSHLVPLGVTATLEIPDLSRSDAEALGKVIQQQLDQK